MDKELRQKKILEIIKSSTKPISASALGKKLHVSRQLIVGDVALLRASGEKIFATPRGYMIEPVQKEKMRVQLVCKHDFDQMEKELNVIVDEGGEVVDVLIEHPVYGELRGNLHLVTRHDVRQFMDKITSSKAPMLSDLSQGIHLHTICCDGQDMASRIEKRLQEEGFLYHIDEQ